MKLKTTIVAVSVALLSFTSYTSNAAEIFIDSFESGDMSATNKDGFSWGHNNRTFVVTQLPKGDLIELYHNEVIKNKANTIMPDGSTRDWTAIDGNNSLLFRYPANKKWTEQRFDLGAAYPELWIKFWLRVPENFSYNTTSERKNNKFFSIWMDGYETKGDGSTIWWGMKPHNTTNATLGFTYSKGQFSGSLGYRQHKLFISKSDQGRWMQVVLHIKAESVKNASDGIIQTFRRWHGETKFTKIHEILDASIRTPDTGPAGFKIGYILGWANGPYEQETEWLLDKFTISDTSPFQKPPKPPTNISIE